MAQPLWTWDAKTRRYRSPTGRFVGQRQMLVLRDKFAESVKLQARTLTDSLASGSDALGPWMTKMRDLIKRSYIDQYVLARGGRNAMTKSDWGRVGRQIQSQYKYLQAFAEDAAAGKMSAKQMGARAEMYLESSTQAFERGKAASYSLDLELPAYPGDGSTDCLSNCKCHWQISEHDDHWEATWKLGAADHCGTCVSRSASWAPLIVEKE